VSRFSLRVAGAAGARGNSPAFAFATAGSDSPRALIRPHRRCSARDNGKTKAKDLKTVFKPPSTERPEASRSVGGASLPIWTDTN